MKIKAILNKYNGKRELVSDKECKGSAATCWYFGKLGEDDVKCIGCDDIQSINNFKIISDKERNRLLAEEDGD